MPAFFARKVLMREFVMVPLLRDNYSVIVHDHQNGWTIVVDPAESEPVQEAILKRGWSLTHILNTHFHADHVAGNLALKQVFGALVLGAEDDREIIPGLDIDVWNQERLLLGPTPIRVLRVPGHTRRHVAYYLEENSILFVGDTLFSMGCGRVLGGTAADLWSSLDELRCFPSHTQIYCAHEYTEANGRFALSVDPRNLELQERYRKILELRKRGAPTVPFPLGEELATNPFLRPECENIRKALGFGSEASNLEVFSTLRTLKDHF